MADLIKHAPHHMPYHAEFGRSVLKDAGINTGELQNWEALELRSLAMGGVIDPQDTRPTPTCVTTICEKGCTHK